MKNPQAKVQPIFIINTYVLKKKTIYEFTLLGFLLDFEAVLPSSDFLLNPLLCAREKKNTSLN